MKSLCITGLIQDDLDFMVQVLRQAGMQADKPSKRDINVSMKYWHDQVLKLPIVCYTADDDESAKTPDYYDLGSLWEQLASDIFINNLDSDVWGWADTRSAEVLPFWKKYDPQIRFILITVKPDRYIANYIDNTDDRLNHQALLTRWSAFHQALLRFHRDNPTISVLVDFEDCAAQLGGLIRTCNNQFKLGLTPVHFPNVTHQEISAIARFLAVDICASYPSHQNFALDLLASLTSITYHHGGDRIVRATELIADYRALKNLVQSQAESIAKHDDAQLSKVPKAELESLKSQYQQLIGQEKDTQKNNHLLLVQLQQAHKESENYFLKLKEANEQLEGVKKLQQELEVGRKQTTALQQELEEVKKQKNMLQKGLESLKSEYQQLISRGKDTQEESDLLLAQLHQVQEELENYFLKYKNTDEKLQSLESRWNRMSARHPDNVLADTIEVITVQSSGVTQWRINGLDLGAKRYDDLQFSSFIEGGIACLVFTKNESHASVLMPWPGIETDSTVVFTTVGNEFTGPQRAKAMQTLSATDWQLVRTIVGLLSRELALPKCFKPPEGFDNKVQAIAFEKLMQELDAMPPLLHFDGLRLGICQEELEYECLTFAFEKCWVGHKFLPEFKFKFASVNIPAGQFASHPRLEFHECHSKLAFDNWFEESKDEFGPKLELRFAQPAAMDLDVWQKMSEKDRGLIAALIVQLPYFIKYLEKDNSAIQRPWADWIKMSDEIHSSLLICTASLKPKPSAFESNQTLVADNMVVNSKTGAPKKVVKQTARVKRAA